MEIQSRNGSTTSRDSGESNIIRACIEKHFDSESYAKFQQVLEYLGEALYEPLFRGYNTNLVKQLQALQSRGVCTLSYTSLKVKFYTFRFISNVGSFVLEKLEAGETKAEDHFITLTKILLYHGLTSKSDTANLALVELEQLCVSRRITLHTLYSQNRAKFLRLIIKAILHKLMSVCDSNETINSNGSFSANESSWSASKNNCVIIYMTRALEVFNVATITSEDVTQSLIITTNLILKEKYNEAIRLFLDYLASYQNIDKYTLIRSHIQSIMVNLLLKRKLSHYDMTAALNKLCSFCGKAPSELLAMKFTFIKGRLLLHYSVNPKSVTDGIYYLSKFEKEEHEQPFEDEFEEEKHFIDYLNPSMIGILLGVDFHFTSHQQELGSPESIKSIESLGKILSLLSESQVQTIHVKLLSTLSLLLRLRPNRNDRILNTALKELWEIFVSKLTEDLKISLIINLCVALYDLLEDCPDLVSGIYTDLLCRDNSPRLMEQLKSLFFIPNLPSLSHIYKFLTPYVRRDISVSNLQELQQSLDCVLPLIKFENRRCRLLAISRMKQLLQSNQKLLISNMLVNLDEPLDCLISKTIQSLLALASTQDAECSILIAECLGILGAVNPIRLDHLIYGKITDETSLSVTNLSDARFIVDLIERLKSSLFSDQRSESETANYALQVVVKTYSVFSDNKIKQQLSEEALRACQLCRNTSYSGTKKVLTDTSLSVYERFKTESQYSYKEWLDKFSVNLISAIKDKRIQEVLYACSYIFKYNLKLAEYLLPHAVIHIIINQPTQVILIKREIMAILDEDVGVSTQDLATVYAEDVRGSIQTLHLQCANMTFCTLDAIQRLDSDTRGVKPLVNLNPKQLDSIRDFIATIPKDKLAILASKCRSQTRALCYFEQYLSSNRNQLDKFATSLQRIYVALDDTYEAAGIEMIRTTPTTIIDDVANYEACGRFDKAFTCCSTSLDLLEEEMDREPLIEDSLRCLSNQGDTGRLYEKSRQLIADYPQYKRNILPYAVEAIWKLGRWDELSYNFNNEQLESLLESACVSQGFLLNSTLENRSDLDQRLKIVHQRLMKPLSIAMMDRSAYFRGYRNLLALHSIGDFVLALDMLDSNQATTQELDENVVDSLRVNLSERLDSLFDLWNKRNKLVQASLRSLEPLVEWQRSLSLTISKQHSFLRDRIHIDVGRMWLTSADSAREARSFDRSFFCLTQAQRWFGTEFDKLSLDLRVRYHVQQAKLDWDQGEQTKAIRGLKLSLERLKDHRLYQHLISRHNKNQNTDPFPQLNNLSQCAECCTFDLSERESFAELKMLLTHYCEEAAAGLPETLFFMYEECVHLGVNQEETYFRLARYYDRLLAYYMDNPTLCGDQAEERNQFDTTQRFSQNLMSGDREEVYTKLMEHSIIAFGNSLKYGVRYLRESMPRLLNIWYDLGSKKSKLSQPGVSRSISSRIENTVRFIDELKNKSIPPYYFMSAISILLSRVTHPHSGVSKKTCEIMELLLLTYPHQITWQMLAMLNDSENEERKKAAKQIFFNSRKKSPKIEKIVRDTVEFARVVVELCYNHGPCDRTRPESRRKKLTGVVNLKEITPHASKIDFSTSRVMAPVEASIRAILPTDSAFDELDKHVVFPDHNVSFIRAIEPRVRIFNSLQQPRQLSLQCDNGKTVHVLCKSGDDLRKDSRCVEFLNLLNRILRRDSQSNARFLEIQTFLVLPLESLAGIIEMVPNCESLRNIVEPLYREKKPNFSWHDQMPKKTKDQNPNDLYQYFKETILPKVTPPVLPTWFLRKFTEPTAWYMARLAFTRTAAVISMGGYIIGLGDRHLDNILVDTCNGRLVHVDFNLLFHQGETLPTPERVPFRLTQNMVAAFGSVGTEGNFRKVCEITMRVMRKEKDALLTTLKPFMHDPCSEWIKVRDTKEKGNRLDHEDRHAENKSAKSKIEVTERKLKGFPRSKKFKPLTLIDSYSVEAQVDNLIDEASDMFNLAQMYYGWCAWM